MRELYVFCKLYLGEVMITQVSGHDTIGVMKDPRRKAQSIQFKHRANIPYKSGYNEQYEKQKSNALWTSVSIVMGAVLFTIGYFVISALRDKHIKV